MGNSVLLENKPHIESIWQYIRIPSRIFFISSLVKISPDFRTLPKIFRKFYGNIIKTSEDYFWTVSEVFRKLTKFSEHVWRFPKIFRKFKKNHKNIWKLLLNRFPNTSEDFRPLPKTSENLKYHKTIWKLLWTVFRILPKIFGHFRRFSKIFWKF